MAKRSIEKFKIFKNVFDEFTINTLFKLSSQGHFDELIGPVQIGKESNVFLAETKEHDFVIVKVYRLHSCNFNKMYSYIRSDPRFMDLKNQRRQVIFKWVQREYRNLLIAREGINVPTPIAFSNNVLVMESIGANKPATQLKDIDLQDPGEMAKKIFTQTYKLHDLGLVHGDLSEFNILVHEGNTFFIDFSQATSIKDPNAKEYFERDLGNLIRFFRKTGTDVTDLLKKK